jgi:hypothetical protein
MTRTTALTFAVGLSILLTFTGVAADADDSATSSEGADAGTGGAAVENETPTDEPAGEPDDDAFAVEQPSEPLTEPEEPPPKTFEKLPSTETVPAPATDPNHPAQTPPTTESQTQAQTAAPQGLVTIQTFHTELSPHGTWYDSPEHGWVWRPRVGVGWRPYGSHGRWIYTTRGWMWRSYHRWGWAPFHYGRWFVHPSLGWSWVPGTAWAPAWVSWRHTGGHVGWAPVPPGYTSYTSATAHPLIHNSHWVFVAGAHLVSPRPYRYAISHAHPTYAAIYGASVYSPVYTRVGRVAHAGPQPVVIARTIGRVVRAIPVVTAARPGARVTANAIPIYRPVVRAMATQTRPVVGVRGAAFTGGRPGAALSAVPTVHRPHGFAATPSIVRWRPAAVSSANAIRATAPPIRPSVIRPGTTLAPRPSVVRPTRPLATVRPIRPYRPYRPSVTGTNLPKPYKPPVYVPRASSKPKKKSY